MYNSWENNECIIDPDDNEIARYDRKALTKSLADLLDIADQYKSNRED